MEGNIATIEINPSSVEARVTVKTNGVSNLDMLEHLNVLVQFFAKAIIDEAKEIGCKDDAEFDEYVEFLRKNKL